VTRAGELPADHRAINKAIGPCSGSPRTPGAPIPRRIGIRLRGHLLLVGEVLLLLMQLVLVVCLLCPHIQATAHERIGIDIVNRVAIDALDKLVCGQPVQHDLPFRRIGGTDDKSCSREVILVLRHYLLLRLARGKGSKPKQQTAERGVSKFVKCIHV
jgi:hypothetical protein